MRSDRRNGRDRSRGLALLGSLVIGTLAVKAVLAGDTRSPVVGVVVVGDAIPAPLTSRPADPQRGRAIVLDRRVGNCLICHQAPVPGEPFQGDLGPDLAGVASRWTIGQIRLRLVDPSRLNPVTLMPAYHKVAGLNRVAAQFAGRPVLTAEEVEDVVAWLATLK